VLPGGAQFDGHDPGRRVVEQLAVVADHQDRLRALVDPPLEPLLARHVEEVVRLVEQQHLVRTCQQVLEHEPLLLAAGQCRQVAVLRLVVADPERRRAAHVPGDLDVVATRVGVVRQRRGIAHLGLLVVAVHQHQLEALHLGRCRADPRRGHGEQEVGDILRDTWCRDHLPHHAEAPAARDRARVRHEVAGHDPQQRGLAGPVGADQCHLRALTDAERDVVEQHPSVGELEAHPGDVDVTHAPIVGVRRPARIPKSRRRPERPLNRPPSRTPAGQAAHRNGTGKRGRFVGMTQERERQERRTRTVRRTVVALGATGALGAAGAIGFGIASAQGADPTTDDSGSHDLPGDDSGSGTSGSRTSATRTSATGTSGTRTSGTSHRWRAPATVARPRAPPADRERTTT
jgi:hypothetical protein